MWALWPPKTSLKFLSCNFLHVSGNCWRIINLFFLNFVGHMSIFGATDTPVSDFWWLFIWVSKPEWAALFAFGRDICDICSPEIHLWCNNFASVYSNWSLSPHACFNRGRMPDLNCRSPAWLSELIIINLLVYIIISLW